MTDERIEQIKTYRLGSWRLIVKEDFSKAREYLETLIEIANNEFQNEVGAYRLFCNELRPHGHNVLDSVDRAQM